MTTMIGFAIAFGVLSVGVSGYMMLILSTTDAGPRGQWLERRAWVMIYASIGMAIGGTVNLAWHWLP